MTGGDRYPSSCVKDELYGSEELGWPYSSYYSILGV